MASLALAVLFICLVVTLNGCTGWLARSIVWGPNTGKAIDPAADPGPEQWAAMGVARQLRAPVGPPAADLSVWVIDPPGGISLRGTILVLHGIIDKKDTMLGVARDLAASGFRTVPVDLRAHGRSSGQWLTFGVVEARDLSQVLDVLETQDLLAGPVGVFGPSYGGAVAIQFAAADPRVRAVVAVCPFTSMRDVTPGVVRMYAPWPIGWLLLDRSIGRAVTEAGRIANFDPDQASPLAAIAKTDAQVLLIHGRDDRKIPPAHSQRLHDAARQHSRLILLEGHSHDSILAGDSGGKVLREAREWFEQWVK